MFAQDVVEGFVGEARMAHLNRVAEAYAFVLVGKRAAEGFKVGAIKGASGGILPVDRSQTIAELRDAGADEIRDGGLHVRGGFSARAEPVRLHCELEAVRGFGRPFSEGVRLLRAVEGGVDLDGGEFARGEGEMARFRQGGRVESLVPRLVNPAADADADGVRHGGSFAVAAC